MNGGVFAVPSAAAVEQFVVAIAAGDIDEDQAADWLRQYVTWPSS